MQLKEINLKYRNYSKVQKFSTWKNENQKSFQQKFKSKRKKFRKNIFVGKLWEMQNKMTQIGSNGYKLLKSESNHESEEGIILLLT